MVQLNIRDDRRVWMQAQEGQLILIGLDDEYPPRTRLGIGPEVHQFTAHDEARRQALTFQYPGQHAAGRGLAMGAGHRQGAPPGRQFPPKLVPSQYWDPTPPGLHQFDVVGGDGGGGQHQVGPFHQVRAMAKVHRDPLL